jgi:son of sevenless-like protein
VLFLEYCVTALIPNPFRIINVLKYWIEHHFTDFQKDPDLLTKLNVFITEFSKHSSLESSLSVLSEMQRKYLVKTEITSSAPDTQPRRRSLLSMPMLKKASTQISLLEVDVSELARQLTLIDYSYFSAIDGREFLELGWFKPEKEKFSPNIMRMNLWSEQASGWIVTEIVSQKVNKKNRVQLVEKAIQLGTVTFILSSFGQSADR